MTGDQSCLRAGGPSRWRAAGVSGRPITLSQEESQRLCGEILPRLADRATRLAERAEDQRAKGQPRIAERLDERAERRAGRIDQLNRVEQRLDGFRTKHCRPISGTK